MHPDYLLAKLTYKQWSDWQQYREQRGEIGSRRDDFRAEVTRLRYINSIFGGVENVPSPLWPYWEEIDIQSIIDNGQNTEEDIIPNGKGGYRWRQQSEP